MLRFPWKRADHGKDPESGPNDVPLGESVHPEEGVGQLHRIVRDGRLVGRGAGCGGESFWCGFLVALEVIEKGDDVVGRRRCGALGGGLEEERLADVGVEQMFCGGEACGVFYGVGKAGDVEDDGVGGFFGAQAFASFEAALAEGAREAEDSGDRLDIFLLRVGERGKRAAFSVWLGAAMEADGPAEEIPLFVGPAWRHGKFAEETAGGFRDGF